MSDDDEEPTGEYVFDTSDGPRFFRPGELADDVDVTGAVRRIERTVCEIQIKLDSVLDFLRRDREESLDRDARINQLERDFIDQRRAVDEIGQRRRKAGKK